MSLRHHIAALRGVEARSYTRMSETSWLKGHAACGREHCNSARAELRLTGLGSLHTRLHASKFSVKFEVREQVS